MEITTLIPGYKTANISSLISGIANQTVKPCKIIISDDSKDLAFSATFLNAHNFKLLENIPIEYYKGPQNGAYENFKHLINIWNHSSELVHLMLDDDFIFPLFYEKHQLAHSSGNFSCSVSSRWSASPEGLPIKQQDIPTEIRSSSKKIISLSEDFLFQTTAADCKNWLGEFSNTVMHKSTCNLILKPELAGISYAGLWDLGYFINSSQFNPIAYINEYMSFFRLGGDSNSSKINGPHMKAAFLAYAALNKSAQRLSKIDIITEKENYKNLYNFLTAHYFNEIDILELKNTIKLMSNSPSEHETDYINLWNKFLASHKL